MSFVKLNTLIVLVLFSPIWLKAENLKKDDDSSICDPKRDRREGVLQACGILTNSNQIGYGLESSRLDHLRALRVHFTGSDLTASSLRFASLRESIAKNAIFNAVQARELKITGGNYYKAQFKSANLEDCEFRGVFAPFIDFSEANLKGCRFIRCFMPGAIWNQAKIQGAQFINSIGTPPVTE